MATSNNVELHDFDSCDSREGVSSSLFVAEKNVLIAGAVANISAFIQASMLVGVAECIGQAKWNWFTQKSQKLHHFRTFDGASRGPWGSLILLFRMRWRTVFASIGAFIVFAAIGIDPFTQQVLSFPLRSTAVPESSFIQRAQFWDQNDLTYKGQSGKLLFPPIIRNV